MKLYEKYPNIFERLEDKQLDLRHLLNVDENYEDYDSEEFEFDAQEYNYVVYIAEPLQNILGKEKLSMLAERLEKHKDFERFLLSEEDLYGLQCDLTENEIAEIILGYVEALV